MAGWVLVAALCVLAFAFQGQRGIWQPDEGRYTAVALQMLESGDWIHPRLAPGVPHYTKPPLVYWGIAASLAVFGRREWAARLPSILAYVGTALVVFFLGRRLGNPRPWLGAAVYATMLAPAIASGIVNADPPLCFFESLAVLGFVAAWWGAPRERLRWQILTGAAFGLAFLTKGPPGLLPLAALLAFAWATEGFRGWRKVVSLPGALAFLVVGCWWYAVVTRDEEGLLSHFLSRELLGRLFDPEVRRNAEWYGPIKMYAPVLLLGTLPWTWVLLCQAPRARALFSRSFWRETRKADPQTLLLLAWLFVPLLVFVLSRSRLPLYVLPLFVPLALLLDRHSRGLAITRGKIVALCGWLGLILAIRVGLGLVPSSRDVRPLAACIAAAKPGALRRIVFVDERPLYALAFYTAAAVEHAAAAASYAQGHPELDPVATKLRESPGPRVWVLPQKSPAVEAFHEHAARAGLEPREIARCDDLVLYETPGSP